LYLFRDLSILKADASSSNRAADLVLGNPGADDVVIGDGCATANEFEAIAAVIAANLSIGYERGRTYVDCFGELSNGAVRIGLMAEGIGNRLAAIRAKVQAIIEWKIYAVFGPDHRMVVDICLAATHLCHALGRELACPHGLHYRLVERIG